MLVKKMTKTVANNLNLSPTDFVSTSMWLNWHFFQISAPQNPWGNFQTSNIYKWNWSNMAIALRRHRVVHFRKLKIYFFCHLYRRDHIYTRAWVKYESIIRKTKRVGGRGVDLNITIILDPWFFWNYIVYFDGGLVAPVSRSEFDERLGDSYEI